MSATFACPSCAARYPVKPVLIGKVVRCKTCQKPFKLRGDGIADAVVEADAAQTPVSDAAQKPDSDAVRKSTTSSRMRPLPAPDRNSSALTRMLTREQEEARKSMAGSLTVAIGQAIKADKADSVSEVVAADAKAEAGKKGSSAHSNQGKDKKRRGPPILTNEGEREAANDRRWLIGLVLAVSVIVGLSYLVNRTPVKLTPVDEFTAQVAEKDLVYGQRLPAITARAWLPDITPFITLPKPVATPPREVKTDSLVPLTKVKGLVRVPTAHRWTTTDRVAWLTKTAQGLDEPTLAKTIERAGVPTVSEAALRRSLAEHLDDTAVEVVMRLMLSDAKSPFRDAVASGTPLGFRWYEVQGKGGSYLVDPGQNYRIVDNADWRGVLVSFTTAPPTPYRFAILEHVRH